MLVRSFFRGLEERWGAHAVDLFASDANYQCGSFYSLHWCRGTAGVNAFAYFWGGEPLWVNSCPCMLMGRVWRKLKHDGATVIVLVPLWEFATWWGLVVPDGAHFSEVVDDWVWFPMDDRSLFVPGSAPGGKDIVQPDWQVMAVRVDFLAGGDRRRIPLRDKCVHGGCGACRCRTWHR